MAGRGRGRGRGSSAFKPEQFGLNKSDISIPLSEEPPPVFPTLINKPLPISDGDEQEYFLKVKREFRDTWNASPYMIEYSSVKKDIERYSDRYTDQARADYNAAQRAEWNMDKTRFPKELLEVSKKRPAAFKPNLKKKMKATGDVGKTLDELEKEEKEETEGATKSAASEDEEGVDEIKDDEVYDEAEMEEGTDYGMSYFDNGEDYLDNEDDNLDDGPVY